MKMSNFWKFWNHPVHNICLHDLCCSHLNLGYVTGIYLYIYSANAYKTHVGQ